MNWILILLSFVSGILSTQSNLKIIKHYGNNTNLYACNFYDGEIIYLTCLSYDEYDRPFWVKESVLQFKNPYIYSYEQNPTQTHIIITLSKEDDGKTLVCAYTYLDVAYQDVIKFIHGVRNTDSTSSILPGVTTTNTTGTTTTGPTIASITSPESAAFDETNQMNPEGLSSPVNFHIIFSITGLICLIMLILMIVIIVSRRCRHKMKQEKIEAKELIYDNLSIENENSNKIPPNLDYTYAMPYGSTMKIIDDDDLSYTGSSYQSSAAYTDINLQELSQSIHSKRGMYAKVMPKSQRCKNDSEKHVDVTAKLTYAEIDFDIPKVSVIHRQTQQTPYNKILGIAKKMDEGDREQGYLNVIKDNSRYVNANDNTEYAEPAYCELKRY